MRVSGTLTILLAVLLASPTTGPGLAVAEGIRIAGDWVVDRHEIVEGGTLLLTGDVRVAAGGELVLRGVDVVVSPDGLQRLGIRVEDGGVLKLLPMASSRGDQPTRLASGVVRQTYDLTVDGGGTLVAQGARVQDASVMSSGTSSWLDSQLVLSAGALRVAAGHTAISGGVVRDSPGHLLHLLAGRLDVAGTTLSGAGLAGVQVENGSTLHVSDAVVEDTGGYGMVFDGATATVTGSRFTQTTDYALRANDAEIDLRANTFDVHCGAFLAGDVTGHIAGNTFQAEGRGISFRDAAPGGSLAITANLFDGTAEAIALALASPELRGNTFRNNGVAIILQGSDATIANNDLSGNGEGIRINDQFGTSAPQIRDNDFRDTAGAALRNGQSAAVDATGNWWGDAAGPPSQGPGAVVGSVIIAPWLTAPGG